MIKNEQFVVIQGYMINDLGLKGAELMAYAVINGFSQDGESEYTGSAQYLAEWCGIQRRQLMNVLSSLVEKGLIIKRDIEKNGVKFCHYSVNKNYKNDSDENCMGCAKITYPPYAKIAHNNIENIDIDIKKESKKKKTAGYDAVVDEYTNNDELKKTIYEFIKMRVAIKKPMTDYALKLIFLKLNKLANTDAQKIKILEQSIENGYQGVFEIKTGGSYGKPTQTKREYI